MWQAMIQQLSDTLMFTFEMKEKKVIHGGDINQSYMISDGQLHFFVKLNERRFYPRFELESEDLRLLHQSSTVTVPEVVLVGTTKEHAFLILNYINLHPLHQDDSSFQFGVQLARLHNWGEQKEYGYDQDNYIGTTLQPNTWNRKWRRFYSEQRIGWQLQLLTEKGVNFGRIDEIVSAVKSKIGNHNPKPSLLHGDLWFGNVSTHEHGPICYDPACYWGDSECDIAMTELFGGFSPAFYAGYQSFRPLDSGYANRKDIYNLYHVLNHCNLFGGQYIAQTESLIAKILN